MVPSPFLFPVGKELESFAKNSKNLQVIKIILIKVK